MSRPPEPGWPRVLLGYVIFAAAVVLAAAPVYVYARGEHRPSVVRLAAAVVLAVVFVGVRGRLGSPYPWVTASAFEAARQREPLAPRVDRRFHELREQVRSSIARDRYFEHVLWPELRTLLEGRPPARPIGRPPARTFGRGPSAKALAAWLVVPEEDG